jgi:hypothetical protein
MPLHNLRTEAGKVSLETLREELAKLELVRAIGLPPGLFRDLSPRMLRIWRQQVSVEELYELRRHPDPIRLSLLGVYCVIRERELTDTLVDILLDMVHRIASRAEERVEKRLQSDVRRVSGKQTLLFRLAEAAVAQPERNDSRRPFSCGQRTRVASAGRRVAGDRSHVPRAVAGGHAECIPFPLSPDADPVAGIARVPHAC